ncbi:MAG: hypothetical protein M0017_03030, partial [Desulfobacteraceae bacterium]|nr:hypothetical protein [Desulfobacteraceae bacterium]
MIRPAESRRAGTGNNTLREPSAERAGEAKYRSGRDEARSAPAHLRQTEATMAEAYSGSNQYLTFKLDEEFFTVNV